MPLRQLCSPTDRPPPCPWIGRLKCLKAASRCWTSAALDTCSPSGVGNRGVAGLSPNVASAQVAWLHHELTDLILKGLEVDSVDAFQGREKAVMIFDTVRSNTDGQVGFLADQRRVNVAMTRAQHQLLVLADSATLSHDPVWSAFFDHAMAHNAYRSVFELASLQEFV